MESLMLQFCGPGGWCYAETVSKPAQRSSSGLSKPLRADWTLQQTRTTFLLSLQSIGHSSSKPSSFWADAATGEEGRSVLRWRIRAQAFQRRMASSFPAGRIASASSTSSHLTRFDTPYAESDLVGSRRNESEISRESGDAAPHPNRNETEQIGIDCSNVANAVREALIAVREGEVEEAEAILVDVLTTIGRGHA